MLMNYARNLAFFLVCCVFENEKLDAINVYVGCLVYVAKKLENKKH